MFEVLFFGNLELHDVNTAIPFVAEDVEGKEEQQLFFQQLVQAVGKKLLLQHG